MGFDDIVGQDRAIRLLRRMIERQRVPHALLFTGIDGCGRQTTAKALAMVMNCRERPSDVPCNRCGSCRKMLSGNHPDLIVIDPDGVYIKIDQIRSLRKRLRYAPVDGGCRVIIVNDAHKMNPEASNAMLKTLEEPPRGTYIVLTAPEMTDLMETIVSRCQQVAFRPVCVDTIVDILERKMDMDGNVARAIAVLAKGSPGKALSADTEKWMAWRTGLIEYLLSLSKASIPALFGFAEVLSRDKDRLHEALDMLMIWFRDILICRFCPDNIVNTDYAAAVKQGAKQISVEDTLKKLLAVSSAQQKISRNANRRLVLEVMMLQLAKIVHKKMPNSMIKGPI